VELPHPKFPTRAGLVSDFFFETVVGPPRRRFINSREEMLSRTVLQKSSNDTIRSSGRVELVSSPPDALLPRARRSTALPSLDLRQAITGEEQAPGIPGPFPSLHVVATHHHVLMQKLLFFFF